MSTAKENPCRKFQANFFNKSKCQNCFKPRELHLLTDQDLTQAKPIYGGWLCLAPEGTDFDNPMQRSRKWQRRFFVLYEHGCLRFALDESPSTLPQGTVNMNLCTDVIDAEPKTGQKNSLCIITPDQEYFIRGENKEIINGWSEQLVVYPRTNKQNQKKKRKVEPTTSQEPGPAKVAVTGSGIPEAEKVPDSSSIIWQEELNQREAEGAAVWPAADLPPGSPLPPTGDVASVAQGSDAGSVNGDEVDRASMALHGSAPQPPSDLLSPTGSCSSLGGVPRCLSPAPSDPFPSGSSLLSNGSHISGSVSSLDSDASGSTVTSTDSHPANQRGGHSYSHHDTPRSRRLEAEARKAEKRSRYRSPDKQEREAVLSPERCRSGVIEKLEALELENPEKMEVEESGRSGARQGRSEHRRFHREEQRHDAGQGLDFPSTLPPLRRAKSLDRRTTESVMTPDLLNFKKGWMVKLDEQGQWKKYWFVLTDHSLRYYKDSIAEEASDLDGEIDLSTCCNVTEYQAQRNYGFQIHTQEGVHTLSAMTAGIRRNWIQAVMKNVRPSTAPDVASSTEDHGSFSPLEGLVRPDVTQDSPSSEASSVERESTTGVIKSRARERRREGRSKTFDWAEFRPIAQALAQQRAQEAESLHADLGELERSRRREERRKRYESVTSTSAEQMSPKEGGRTDCESGEGLGQTDSLGPMSLERQQRVEEVIEQHWQQVESTPIREERRVPLPATVQSRETAELEQLLENYKQGIEDLKAQLESCHQQLLDSNKHKQELELQLRTALEREQDVRTGYISPLEHPLGLEADVTPQTKRPELVSSQAQSLTKKYQETKELLKLQELKKRNMQAQLGLSLSHIKEPYFSDPQKTSILEGPPPEPVQKKVSFLLHDNTEAIQELEDFIIDRPITIKELAKLLRSHSCNQETAEKHHLQKLLESWKYQQEIENETLKKSLARAGESIREYESRLLTMEDLVGKVKKQSNETLKSPYGPLSEIENHSETNEMTIGMLSQRIELLTSENGALKQRCQEIVNQLTEADREIDRLKAELISQQGGKQHHLVMEELKRLKAELAENQANAIDREYYERELNEKSLRLHEALVTLEELGNTLKDTEKKLQLKEATLKGLGFRADYEEEEEEELHTEKELLEASQAKLLEMEAKLQSAEQRCLELEARNGELITLNQESEQVSREKLKEAENEIRMLREKLEMKTSRVEETVSGCPKAGEKQVGDKGLIKQVVEKIEMKSEAINKVLEMLAKVDVNVEKMFSDLKSTLFGSSEEEPVGVSQKDMRFVMEGEFWSQLLGTSEDGHSCERDVAEQMMAQKRLMLLIRRICPQAEVESEIVTEQDLATMYSWLDNETNALIYKELTETLEAKSNGLKQIVSDVKLAKDDKLLSLALASFDFGREQKQSSEYLLDALNEAYMFYVTTRLKVQHEKELKQKQTEVQMDGFDCPNCPELREAARDLESKLADLQSQLSENSLKTTRPQTLIQIEGEPIDSVDKYIELHDMVARHRKELREVKEGYEREAEKLRQEITKASETLRVRSEENVKEIDSLTNCIENLKKKHEMERANLMERFDREMEELRGMMSPTNPEKNLTDEDRPPHHALSQTSTLKERIQELVTQVSVMTQEMRRREEQGDITTLRLKYEKDLENLKATCERGFAAMEESHQKVIDELQRKHQRELENLHEEKERLLAEETAATIAAIEAMKNAHRSELEKELDKARKANSNTENADIEEIRRQHEEELCSFQREIEVLSEQYSQKCLENAHLAQALEAERQALRQCQRENQELNAHNQELNNRLAAEITKMRSMTSEDGVGDTNTTIQGKELYELEVMLRVKESEVQYLKQEINSLKDELQAAQRDKKYATDKYKDIYTELSIVKAKAERDLGRLRDQLQLAHEALGEPSLEDVERGGYDIMKSKSNPDILKMAAAAAKRSERTMRSKSVNRDMPWDS
ncbi:Myosin phosphatase Rho-interacting protein Rho-interacting protein 3 [Larimichthys crocea]|uniref:Myosin phosphatase Rho-interacting protein Rho-interacting protein 3 n=1 Tax=Larimichthys crocea TaxID=215358 RepID=A0A6G0I099_LARCR|nr:Myosin phosphatase Rho-interacting protein Rho-interacting protein 3 [Larimichthys crocea]